MCHPSHRNRLAGVLRSQLAESGSTVHRHLNQWSASGAQVERKWLATALHLSLNYANQEEFQKSILLYVHLS